MEDGINVIPQRALLVVDVQNDFVEGVLATHRGVQVAAAIDAFMKENSASYAHCVGTLDWHIEPGEHFVQWPAHCRAGSPGAQPYKALDMRRFEAWFRKGEYSAAYSGFEGHLVPAVSSFSGLTLRRPTIGLEQWLRDRDITHVDVAGMATDYCVRATALDAQAAGFHTTVIEKLCAPISEEGGQEALAELRAAGVLIS